MSDTVRLQLLGPPSLVIADEQVGASSFQLALLSRFLLTDRDTVSRAEAARLLWPESPRPTARHNLSQVIYSLKKAAGGRSLVDGTPKDLRLCGLSSDIADFRRAVEHCDWQAAGKLYQGPLLEGLILPRAWEFNDWADSQRARFAELAGEVVEGLHVEGRPGQATSLAARIGVAASALDDLDLPSALAGDGSENTGLREGSSDSEPASGDQILAPFVGRREELARLEQLFTSSTTSGFTTVAVEGEAGIGKTLLTDRFARLRAIRGSRVLTARAYLAEQNVPFGVVAQWVREVGPDRLATLGDPWVEILGDAFPGVVGRDDREGSTTTLGSEYRILEALRRLFLSVTESQPLLLVLDDAHLADPASLSFAHYFSRRSAAAPVLFIATVRVPSLLGVDPFLDWPEVHHVKVDPLPLRDMETLMSRFSGSSAIPSAEEVADLSRTTGGNPLLLVSLLTSRTNEASSAVPDSVMEFFVPRLDALSADAALLLAAVSIAGDRTGLDVAATIAGLIDRPTRLIAAMSELEASALVLKDGCETGETVAARHGIVAEVAVARLPAATRRALYGRAARTLAEEGRSPPAVVAVQHDIAGDRSRAFEAALNAAAASQDLHATREQEFFLKLALSNAPDPAAEGKVRIDLAELFRRLGRPVEALEVVADAVMAGAPLGLRRHAQATRLLTRLSKVEPKLTTASAWAEVQDIEQYLDPDLVAELYYQLAAAAHDFGHTADTIRAAERSLAISRQLPPGPRSALLASRSAMAIGLYTHAEDGLAVIEQLIPAVKSDLEALAQCVSAQATLLVAAGRLIEAETQFLYCIELVERCCLYVTLFVLHNNLGVCYTEQGKYSEAQRQLEEAARVGIELIGPSGAAIAADNLGLLHFERGEYEATLSFLREHPKAGDTLSSRGLYVRHALMGLCALELGRLAKAFEVKREIELFFKHHEYWSNDVSYLETFLARMLVLEGKPQAARDRLETALDVYRGRDMMCRSRLELELARIDLKADPGAALERAECMLELLRGTGARPLIGRFEELADRARLRPA